MSRHQLKPQPTAAERMERKRKAKEQPSKVDYYLAQKAKALSYDYAQIDEDKRELVQRAALDIRSRLKRTVEDMIEIGRRLNEIQEMLPSKVFYEWAQDEFGMSRGSVFEFSQIALRFGEFHSKFERILPSIVRRLAAPSVPDEAVRLVIEAAANRDKALPFKDAMAIVKPFLPPRLVKPKQLPPPPEPEPDDAIDVEYTVAPDDEEAQAVAEVEAERAEEERLRLAMNWARDEQLSFDEWWAMMPAELSLRESLRIFELAKRLANEVRSKHEPLKGKVNNVMMVWSSLITAVEQELKNDGE